MKPNKETREQFYTNIINLAGTPPQESYDKPWAQHPKILDRALALANLSLKRYQEQGTNWPLLMRSGSFPKFKKGGDERLMPKPISLMEMLRRVQQGMPVEGAYLYRRFDWDEPVHVTVEDIDGEIYVRFFVGSYPVGLRNIPIDAIFELVE